MVVVVVVVVVVEVVVVFGCDSYPLLVGRSRDRIPVRTRFFAPVQTGPEAQQTSCTMGTGLFPGVMRMGRVVDHTPPSSAEIKEEVEIYLQSPFQPPWRVLW